MVFVAGHFGEWLQGQVGPDGQVALITLACPTHGVRATRAPADMLGLDDPALIVGFERAARFLTLLDLGTGHAVRLHPDLPPGGGAGMSTAALVATARACGANPDRIAAACLAVEGACDPLMQPQPDSVLWAPRAAKVLAPMPPPPRASILGGFFGPVTPTDPSDHGFPPVDDLVSAWSRGPTLARAASLATESACRTTALRGPSSDPTAALAQALGALGWARAHTGSARALIFAPDTIPPHAERAFAEAGLSPVLRFQTGQRP